MTYVQLVESRVQKRHEVMQTVIVNASLRIVIMHERHALLKILCCLPDTILIVLQYCRLQQKVIFPLLGLHLTRK